MDNGRFVESNYEITFDITLTISETLSMEEFQIQAKPLIYNAENLINDITYDCIKEAIGAEKATFENAFDIALLAYKKGY